MANKDLVSAVRNHVPFDRSKIWAVRQMFIFS